MRLAKRLSLGALTAGASGVNEVDAVVAMFAANEPGYVYDNNDLTTMFSDIRGVTQATVNGSVALQLDKSKGLVEGADQKDVGVIGMVGTATPATYNTSTGEGTVSRAGTSANQSYVEWTLTPNTFYRISIVNHGANVIGFRQTDTTVTPWVSVAAGSTISIYVPTFADGKILATLTTNLADGAFTIVSIKAVAGAHRYQSSAASRPTLRGTPTGANLFTNYQAAGTGWADSGGGVATGTATTDEIQVAFNPVVGRTYRVTWTTTVTSGSIRLLCSSSAITPTTTTSGTYVAYFTATTTGIMRLDGVSAFTGTVSAIDIRDVSSGQVTAPYGLQFDGVDDFMLTPPIDFTTTDAVTCCVGLRKFSDTTAGIFAELGPTVSATNGTFGFSAPSSGGVSNVRFNSRGTALAGVAVTEAAPVTMVLTGISDISADSVNLRVNGVSRGTDADDQGTGNYTSQVFYFASRAGTSAPFTGLGFGGVCLGRTTTANELAEIEQFVGSRTGVNT